MNAVASAAATVALALTISSCVPSFYTARTPSGEPCPDMSVVPVGQPFTWAYHRIRPVVSASDKATEAERLESLRVAACAAGALAIGRMMTRPFIWRGSSA